MNGTILLQKPRVLQTLNVWFFFHLFIYSLTWSLTNCAFSKLQGKAGLGGQVYSGLQSIIFPFTHSLPQRAVCFFRGSKYLLWEEEAIPAPDPRFTKDQLDDLHELFPFSLNHLTPISNRNDVFNNDRPMLQLRHYDGHGYECRRCTVSNGFIVHLFTEQLETKNIKLMSTQDSLEYFIKNK